MEREPLRVPELPPPDDVISAYLIHWAMDSKEGRFCVMEAVTHVPLLWEHLRLSAVEQQELRLCMGKSCCPVYPVVYANEYVKGPSFWHLRCGLSCLLRPLCLLCLLRRPSLLRILYLLRRL